MADDATIGIAAYNRGDAETLPIGGYEGGGKWRGSTITAQARINAERNRVQASFDSWSSIGTDSEHNKSRDESILHLDDYVKISKRYLVI